MDKGRHTQDAATRWLRRSLFGYRRADVHAVLDAQRRELDALAHRVEALWLERRDLVDELASTRSAYEQELAEMRLRAEEREATARATAARIVADAEEQAARLRQQASERVGDAADRLESVLRVREQLLGELRGILDAYGHLLHDAESARPAALVAAAEADAPPAPPVLDVEAAALSAGLSPRRVELDAGPFADFAELASFERSLARLPKVEDVYIVRFGDERASIELKLAEETPLADELARLPFALEVKPNGDGALVLDLHAAAG